MLICRDRLTFVVVTLFLEALLTAVASEKLEAGSSVSSDEPAVSFMDSSRQSLIRPRNNKGKSAITQSEVRPGSKLDTEYRINNEMLSNSSYANSLPWIPVSISTSSSKVNKRNSAKSKEKRKPVFWSEDIQVGCKELRARSYITDGFCTSEKPVKEVVCAGHCLPIMDMPWFAEFLKIVATTKLKDWQCVEGVVRKKRVKLLCQNGTFKHYRIKVVKSCKCKKIIKTHNKTSQKNRNRAERTIKSNNET